MSPIRIVFLVLTIIGTILPWYYFAKWFNEFGWSLAGMAEAWNVNDSTTGMVYDLTVSLVALVIWVIYECVRERRWLTMLIVPLSGFTIGVSCALPLYLFLRSGWPDRTAQTGKA